jgi:hypothetical protein
MQTAIMEPDRQKVLLQTRVSERMGAKVARLAKRKGLTKASYLKMVVHEHVEAAEKAERRERHAGDVIGTE